MCVINLEKAKTTKTNITQNEKKELSGRHGAVQISRTDIFLYIYFYTTIVGAFMVTLTVQMLSVRITKTYSDILVVNCLV